MLGVALVAIFCIVEATGNYQDETALPQLKAREAGPQRLYRRLARHLSLPKAG